MGSIFSRIVSGEIPCHQIAENSEYLAFLDIMPLVPGHVLVIPKKETDLIFDLADDEYSGLWLFAKKLAQPIRLATGCKRVGIAVIGLEVPHAHIHLVPMNSVGDINFSQPKLSPGADELAEMSAKIRKFING